MQHSVRRKMELPVGWFVRRGKSAFVVDLDGDERRSKSIWIQQGGNIVPWFKNAASVLHVRLREERTAGG